MASTRKPLFTKPSWASKANTTSSLSSLSHAKPPTNDQGDSGMRGSDVSIFGQKHIYEDIVAQERRRREKHAQKVRDRERQDGPRESKERGIADGKARNSKRRRISNEDEDEDDAGSEKHRDDSDDANGSLSGTERGSSPVVKKSVTRSALKSSKTEELSIGLDSASPKRTRKRPPKTSRESGADEDEDDDIVELTADGSILSPVPRNRQSPRPKQQRSKDMDSESEEDEYLRDLKKRAREDAKLKRLGITISKARSPSSEHQPTMESPGVLSLDAESLNNPSAAVVSTDASKAVQDDPEVQIFIKTILPNAKSLIVSRRASQPVETVREFWCRTNELHPKIASMVFLTWNGTRLYPSTTMRGIIETLKRTNPMKDGSDPSKGKIMLEAMTQEVFEHRQQQQARKQKEAAERARGDQSATQSESNEGVEGEPESQDRTEIDAPGDGGRLAGVVIRLLCPEKEELNVRVRPNTTISKIITTFKSYHNIGNDKSCWLSYDGDRLDSDQTAGDVGFEHEDTVDVYLR